MSEWIDFTRRNDPACPAGYRRLLDMVVKRKRSGHPLPDVLCFWTKNPGYLASDTPLDASGTGYAYLIKSIQDAGTLVLAQVTANFYGAPLEAGVPEFDLQSLVRLLGPGHIRMRFDPIIAGYTTMKHFKQCVGHAYSNGIEVITVNFFESKYKDTGAALTEAGIPFREKPDKVKILQQLRRVCPKEITIALCAECAQVFGREHDDRPASNRGKVVIPEGFKAAACADATWAQELRPGLTFEQRASRPGCGCCYSGDWGIYRSAGGYTCPHQCLYCYAS